jgi:hypothetical protein
MARPRQENPEWHVALPLRHVASFRKPHWSQVFFKSHDGKMARRGWSPWPRRARAGARCRASSLPPIRTVNRSTATSSLVRRCGPWWRQGRWARLRRERGGRVAVALALAEIVWVDPSPQFRGANPPRGPPGRRGGGSGAPVLPRSGSAARTGTSVKRSWWSWALVLAGRGHQMCRSKDQGQWAATMAPCAALCARRPDRRHLSSRAVGRPVRSEQCTFRPSPTAASSQASPYSLSRLRARPGPSMR